MTVETLGADDPRWDELVDAAPTPDVYFRPGYCRAYEAAGHGRAVAIVTDGALFPLLLRPLPFGEEGYDAATPYGYGGLLPLLTGTDPAPNLRQLRDWCVSNGVVSCLVRLHPLLGGFGYLSETDGARLWAHGPTTAIPLDRWDERTGRLGGMAKGRKADLNVARRELTVDWHDGRDGDALARFRAVYDETMSRLGAGEFYLFPSEYYPSLGAGLGERLGVALAWAGDEVVGGALFLADRRFAHYHLSGTTDAGRRHRATTLLVHDGARWARERGCELLHLGGAPAAGGDDPLFRFKRSFGGREYTYAFATLVADDARYEELTARRVAEPEPPRSAFFPAYRA